MLIQLTNNVEVFVENISGENGARIMAITGTGPEDVMQIGAVEVDHDVAFEIYDVFNCIVWIGDEVWSRMFEYECTERDAQKYVRDCAESYFRVRLVNALNFEIRNAPVKAGVEGFLTDEDLAKIEATE